MAHFSKLSAYFCFNISEPEFIIGSEFSIVIFLADFLVKITVSPFHLLHIHFVNIAAFIS